MFMLKFVSNEEEKSKGDRTMFEEGMNENLYTNDKGMRVHAYSSTPMTREEAASNRPTFGGTYEQSLVDNPLNRKYDTKSVSDRGGYKERTKSAEELDKLRG